MKFRPLPLLLCCLAAAVATGAEEIKKSDGTLYSNVTVEQVDPAGLTISFVNENGTAVLKRIPFEELDAAVQQQYRYDPERARRYEERREQLSRDRAEELKADDESDRAEAIRKKLRERFNGRNVEVSREDLLFLIRSNRRALRVSGVEIAGNGTLVRVLQDDSGQNALPMMILADGLKLKAEESWTGFLYPTGLKARIQGNANLPVFCASAEQAADLVNNYLDIYYQFAAAGGNDAAAGATANASGTSDNPSGIAGIDTKDKSSTEPIDFGNVRNYSGYYFGDSYYPVWWWYYGNWWNRYPIRPRPPRPPFPPRPDRPDRPDRPNWPDRPDRPNWPDRPNRPEKPGQPSRPGQMDRLERPSRPGRPTNPQSRPGTIQPPSREPAQPTAPTRFDSRPNRPAVNLPARPPSRSGNIIPAAPAGGGGGRAMGRF